MGSIYSVSAYLDFERRRQVHNILRKEACVPYNVYLFRWSMQFPKPGHWQSILMRSLVFWVSHHTDPSFVKLLA